MLFSAELFVTSNATVQKWVEMVLFCFPVKKSDENCNNKAGS